jgi:hypothetical protein
LLLVVATNSGILRSRELNFDAATNWVFSVHQNTCRHSENNRPERLPDRDRQEIRKKGLEPAIVAQLPVGLTVS